MQNATLWVVEQSGLKCAVPQLLRQRLQSALRNHFIHKAGLTPSAYRAAFTHSPKQTDKLTSPK